MDKINLSLLSPDQRELADLVGAEVYKRLVETYGGCSIYIPKPDGFIRTSRNEEIRCDFNGYNFKELAKKHRLSEQMIRLIVAPIEKEVRNRVPEEQMTLFG